MKIAEILTYTYQSPNHVRESLLLKSPHTFRQLFNRCYRQQQAKEPDEEIVPMSLHIKDLHVRHCFRESIIPLFSSYYGQQLLTNALRECSWRSVGSSNAIPAGLLSCPQRHSLFPVWTLDINRQRHPNLKENGEYFPCREAHQNISQQERSSSSLHNQDLSIAANRGQVLLSTGGATWLHDWKGLRTFAW